MDEKEVLKHLQSIISKLIMLNKRIHQLEHKHVQMEKIVCSGFAYINKGLKARRGVGPNQGCRNGAREHSGGNTGRLGRLRGHNS